LNNILSKYTTTIEYNEELESTINSVKYKYDILLNEFVKCLSLLKKCYHVMEEKDSDILKN